MPITTLPLKNYVSGLSPAAPLSGTELFYAVQSGNSVKVPASGIVGVQGPIGTTGPQGPQGIPGPPGPAPSAVSIDLTYTQISAADLTGANTILLSGFYLPGDRGVGAIMTTQGASPTGPMAVQDVNGTWFNLVLIDPVNVGWFGAKGDNSNDDTAAIQAAIDAGFAANVSTIYVPPGKYKTTSPLYLDPPLNLRVDLANPPLYQFSMALVGDDILGNPTSAGSQLFPQFRDDVALYIGTGQGMHVSNIIINGTSAGGYKAQRDSRNVGIGLCGGGGGSSRTLVENVWVQNFYTAFKTGANGAGSLCDSNTFHKCATGGVYIAVHISKAQNFINTFYDCEFGDCTIGLWTDQGAGGHVFGGNWSGNGGVANTFPLSAVSALTSTLQSNGNYLLSFTCTATVGSPDINYFDVWFGDHAVYNGFAIKTASFGIIPIRLQTWDSGTGAAEFQIIPNWSYYHFQLTDAAAVSDLSAEIQACTDLYAAERKIPFRGSGISVEGGVHIEDAYAPVTLIEVGEAIGSSPPCNLSDITFNVTPSLVDLIDSVAPEDVAKFYIAQSWPFINIGTQVELTVQNCNLEMATQRRQPVVIGLDSDARLIMRGMSSTGPFNVRTTYTGGFGYGEWSINTPNLGSGEFDITPYFSTGEVTVSKGDKYRIGTWMQHPVWGWRPDPNCRPGIPRRELKILDGPLDAISYSGGIWTIDYPLLWGDHIYTVLDYDFAIDFFPSLDQSNLEFSSHHKFYSYGQNLTTSNVPSLSWSYKGQSTCVYANIRTLEIMFAGLGVILNNGSDGDILYIVSGVYPALGYFTVQRAQVAQPFQLVGDKNTVYTGTTIKQQPYDIRRLAIPEIENYQAPSSGFSITLNDSDTQLILNPATTLATGGITMCANPYNRQKVEIRSTQIITALTISPNSGQSVAGNPSSLAVGQLLDAIYRTADTTWYFAT